MEKIEASLTIRDASLEDCDLLWRWRNDPHTRQSSFQTEPVLLRTHRQWFEKSLKDPKRHIWIVLDDHGAAVGQVRIDLKNSFREAEIDVTVDPKFRGQGYGVLAIKLAMKAASIRYIMLRKLIAYIKTENSASIRSFEKAGFLLMKQTPDVITMVFRV